MSKTSPERTRIITSDGYTSLWPRWHVQLGPEERMLTIDRAGSVLAHIGAEMVTFVYNQHRIERSQSHGGCRQWCYTCPEHPAASDRAVTRILSIGTSVCVQNVQN